MEAKHIELPWSITWVFGTAHIVGNDEQWAAQCHTKEGAEFIVRACNAHDELVKALQVLLDAPDPDSFAVASDEARATLTKAAP